MVFRRSSMMFTLDQETRKTIQESGHASPVVRPKKGMSPKAQLVLSSGKPPEDLGPLPPSAASVPSSSTSVGSVGKVRDRVTLARTHSNEDEASPTADDAAVSHATASVSLMQHKKRSSRDESEKGDFESLDPLELDDSSFGRQISRLSTVSSGLDEDEIRALSTPFANAVLSDWGRRILLVSQEYKEEVIEPTAVWKDFHPLVPVKARRLLYSVEHDVWDSEPVLVQFHKTAFDRGALRECFKMKEIRGKAYKRTVKKGRTDSFALMAEFARKDRTCWVAKRYMDPSHYDLHKQDVAMQMVAKSYAEAFDRERLNRCADRCIPVRWRQACKPVDFLMSHLIEFDEEPGVDPANFHCTPCFSVEAFVYGKYAKYNTNSGLISGSRSTPQAFSHFTFEHSEKSLICVDVQGVDDLYTDPAVHAPTQFLWCDANLGLRGMALFFWTHRCNDACRLLGLSSLNSYSELAAKGMVSWHKNGEVRHLAANTLVDNDVKLSEVRKAASERGEAEAMKRKSLESLLCYPNPEQWREAIPNIEHPTGFKDTLPKDLVESCIHMELCWMYASGRLSESGTEVCEEGSIYHIQQAARGGLVCALLGLARLCSDYPHDDFLPNIFGMSFELCLQLLELAAERGCADAAGSLAQILEAGSYDDIDYSGAAEHYEKYATLMLEGKNLNAEEEDPLLRGISRPTAYYMKFGWDNHGLVPHKALAHAARLYSEGQTGNLLKDSAKAAELYRWASEVAMENMQAKLAMQYEEKANELEASDEEEDDGTSDFGASSNEGEEEKKTEEEIKVEEFSLASDTRTKLEQIGDEIGVKDLNGVIEKLIEIYRLPAPSRRTSAIDALRRGASTDEPFGKRSSLKRTNSGGDMRQTESEKRKVVMVLPDEDESPAANVEESDKKDQSSASAGASPLKKNDQEAAPQQPVEEVEEAAGDFGDDFLAAFGEEADVSAAPAEPVEEVEEAAGDFGDDLFASLGIEGAGSTAQEAVEEVEEAAGDVGDDFFDAFGDGEATADSAAPQEAVEEVEEAAGDIGDDFFEAFNEEMPPSDAKMPGLKGSKS